MANCTKCGAELKDGVKFCTECGNVVAENKPETTPTPQEARQQTAQQPQPQRQPQRQPQQPQPQRQIHTQQAYAQPQQTYQQPAPAYQQPAYAPPAPVYAQPMQEQEPGPDSRYGLISTGGYIGIMLLLAIPIIGFILMIVWACGGCKKLQKRNLCRAMLIVMAVMLVLSLILGFAIRGLAKSVIGTIEEEIGYSEIEKEEASGGLGGLLGGLFGGTGSEEATETSELDALSGLLGGLFSGDLSGLMGEIEDINNEAAQHSNGWPSDLPDYPDGEMDEVEDYRTLIIDSSAESMWSYIDTLKKNGYEFQDFYGIGMSEDDMKSINAWWGTNGRWYLSISYADGTVTIDHTTELPDMSELFG